MGDDSCFPVMCEGVRTYMGLFETKVPHGTLFYLLMNHSLTNVYLGEFPHFRTHPEMLIDFFVIR